MSLLKLCLVEIQSLKQKVSTLADAQARPMASYAGPVKIPQPEDWSIKLQEGLRCGTKAVNKKP